MLVQDVRELGEVLGLDVQGHLAHCSAVRQVQNLHERWRRQLDEVASDDTNDEVFGPPPIDGTDEIQPIRTVGQLRREGREMRHCVGSYAARVRLGRSYVYRVLGPERATLSLNHARPGWRVEQLLGERNRTVRAHTRAVIRAWLAGATVSGQLPLFGR